MSFLQPLILAALPFIALPIVIHLINQRRYQTVRWGAMRFLLAANRMSRGYARLRQWLILLFRMLAIAGLIFAVSRPLASGWVGLAAGGRADTTIIVLDRSPSMQERRQGALSSKLETGREQLARTLGKLRSARWVLIDSATGTPREIASPAEILSEPACEPASSSADLPSMLQAAHEYVQANRAGRTEIWICSDMRQNDWNAEDGRWKALRDSFVDAAQSIRFHLLAYPDAAADNVAIRVTDVRRRSTPDSAELLVSMRLWRGEPAAPEGNRLTVPVRLEIEGARSEISVEMTGPQFELKDHRIALDRERARGWGKVSIPADANPADNDYYFVFDEPEPRHTAVVAEDAEAARALMLAATIAPEPALKCAAEAFTTAQLATLAWEKTSLLVWQAPLPTGDLAREVAAFVDRGGCAVFLPPRSPSPDVFAGLRWQSWSELPEDTGVETWRSDQDLLANTQSGAALPLGQVRVKKHCAASGEHVPLAVLKGGSTLLGRAPARRGGVYFCATTPAPADSTLAANGIVLYVLVQRALALGAQSLGDTLQLVAGGAAASRAGPSNGWRQIAGPAGAISVDYSFHAGVYEAGGKLLAINPPAAEAEPVTLSQERSGELFRGLDFTRVDDTAGSLASLIDEIWRPFLAAMILALIAEALLCMPRVVPAAAATTGGTT